MFDYTRLPTIYFVRHGQTDWNVSQRIQGQIERDINSRGRQQADRNGEKLLELLDDPQDWYFVASPLRRTRETMERIRVAMGLDPKDYATDDRLKELHFGDWQGFTIDELERQDDHLVQARHDDKWNFLPPGQQGESYAHLSRRLASWLQDVNQQTICVTHGGCLRTIFYLLGLKSEQEAANLSIPQNRVLLCENGQLEWL